MRDNFQAFLTEGADWTENTEFPILQSCHEIPEALIAFSNTKEAKDFNSFVHFYERDQNILPFARNPRKYFSRISQFMGALGCDISMYRNMLFPEQMYHTFWNRKLTFWLQNHGISVIPNVRYGDEKTYSFCFEGIPKNSVVSIGTYGCIKKKNDIYYHIKGVAETIKQLKPEAILFYGTIQEDIEFILRSEKVYYKIFRSDTSRIFTNRLDKSCPLFEGLSA